MLQSTHLEHGSYSTQTAAHPTVLAQHALVNHGTGKELKPLTDCSMQTAACCLYTLYALYALYALLSTELPV